MCLFLPVNGSLSHRDLQKIIQMPGSLGRVARRGKEKDRDMLRGIPEILARAGYAIVKVNG